MAGGAEPAKQAFRFEPGDIKKDWTNLKDVEIVVLQHWMEARLRIDKIDALPGSPILDLKPYIPIGEGELNVRVPDWVKSRS